VTVVENEFDRQVGNLIRRGYPERACLRDEVFRRHLTPLKDRLTELGARARTGVDTGAGVPFVIVVSSELVSPFAAMPLVELNGKQGFTTMDADDLKRFAPIDGLEIPFGPAYLLADVDTGAATLNVTPDEAMKTIVTEHRSPLTLAEGVALITQFPAILRTRNCFSMLGSRCGDRRVPALWVSGGAPRLGWCWVGAPHTWLGSASCGGRSGGRASG
jgi:hypothetical protein